MNKKKYIFLKISLFILFMQSYTFAIDLQENTNQQQKPKKSISSTILYTQTKPKIVEEVTTNDKFKLNFNNANLKNVLDYIADLFDVIFLPDDSVILDDKKQKGVNEVKINFKTNKPLKEAQIWSFLDLILENAGLARIHMPGQAPNFYRITNVANANKSNIPTFVGTSLDELPDYQRIRYMYFVQNRQASHIRELLTKLQSKNAQIDVFQDLNVIIVTDTAYNIKTLIQIAKELDNAGLPEILSVLKLKSVDATDVAKLYDSLKGKEDIFRPFGEPKKAGSRLTENTKVIAEPRTNALIIFGPKESVQRLEEFVKTHIDKELKDQPSKIHVYDLNYAPAEQIANILNSVTQFGADSEAARLGGVRGGEKYLSRMFFEPERQGNRLIVRGELEDFNIVKKIIEQLDTQQPQVAIEVFIVTINLDQTKALQSQIRNNPSCPPSTVNFQTSGFGSPPQGIQVDTTNNSGSLVANLINLATTALQGSTLISLGKQSVWALLAVLQTTTDAKIIANPFLVATNKYTATVSIGETQRITTGTIIGANNQETNEFGETQANLSVSVTPQINDYGIINLDIDVTVDNFTGAPNTGNKETRRVHTNANVADQEILALGGLIRNRLNVRESGVPVLSKIPLIGLLFKNKTNEVIKENLVIFMSPRIIRPTREYMSPYTQNKAERVRLTLKDIDSRSNKRDPIHRWFFEEPIDWDNKVIDKFILPSEGGKITNPNATTHVGLKKENVVTTSNVLENRAKRKSISEHIKNREII